MSKYVATSLQGSRVNYANSLLRGTLQKYIAFLQRVKNALAHIVLSLSAACRSISPDLQYLHWLPVEQIITRSAW